MSLLDSVNSILLSMRPMLNEFREAVATPADFAVLALHVPAKRIGHTAKGDIFIRLYDPASSEEIRLWTWRSELV